MLGKEELKHFGQDKIIGLFGDKRFPFKTGPKCATARREGLSHVKSLLSQMNPKKVYLIPHRGFDELAIPLLSFLEIPYIIVNPYKGYFDKIESSSKVRLLVALENSKAVITIGERPKSALEHEKSYEEAIDFIYNVSDVIVCVTAGNVNKPLKHIQENYQKEDKVIILNFIDENSD